MINATFESMSGVFHKVHLSNLPPNAILHTFTGPDTGEPHDHPFSINVTVLAGGYDEAIYPLSGKPKLVRRRQGDQFIIPFNRIHLIVKLHDDQPCQTIATYGQFRRKSGFWRWVNGRAQRREFDGDWVDQ